MAWYHSLAYSAVLATALQPTATAASQLPVEGKLPSLNTATTWLNSVPLPNKDLHGKVVLIQFWTYTCVNWRRTLPYVRAWARKYKDQGLVVVGVHTPEFSFEKDIDNIRRAASEQTVDYPVAVDSNYGIWKAFHNQYWPALYFIDREGRIRHHVFGEGEYDKSELIIQQLLAEGERGAGDHELVSVDPVGAEVAADWDNVQSPETYVSAAKTQHFVSSGGTFHAYSLPPQLRLNEWGLAGDWALRSESAVLSKPNGRIAYRFHARDVNLVMSAGAHDKSIRFRVLIDGQPPGDSHGADVDPQGYGTVDQPRMYQLLRQPSPIADRQVEVEFLDPGVAVFDFTFG